MSLQILNMLLDHFPTLDFSSIAQLLSLEHYKEENTLTISGTNFVLDIFESPLHCLLSFVDESSAPFFNHVELYLNTCLKCNNLKLFVNLLFYFSKIDTCTMQTQKINCEVKKYDKFWICNCIFGKSFIAPFDVIRKKTVGYNIFTHRAESLIEKESLFPIQLMTDKFVLYGRKFAKWDLVIKEIENNWQFYMLFDENCKLKNDRFEFIRKGEKYVVTKEMCLYRMKEGVEIKDDVISFMLKRGANLEKGFLYVENN